MNISALNNITPFEVNNTLINQTSDIGTNLLTNANDSTGGYLGLGIMGIIFIVLLIILMTDADVFRLNFLQALIVSSGLATLIGVIGIVTGIFTNLYHVMYFVMIFIFSIVSSYYRTKQ